MAAPRLRLSLRTFLLSTCFLAAAVGMSVRWWLMTPVKYVLATRGVDGYGVRVCWSENRLNQMKLRYLVVFAKGDVAKGGEGDGVSNTIRSPDAKHRAPQQFSVVNG